MERGELALWLRLTLTPGVGNATARSLLASFGLPETIFRQTATALRQVVSEKLALALAQEPQALQPLLQTTWDWLHADAGKDSPDSRRAILTLADARYPAALLATEDPPLVLYLMGAAHVLASTGPAGSLPIDNGIAVVGSRNPTPQGASNARAFARALAGNGLCIVSGLALGVDGAAHEGALEGGAEVDGRPVTIAVVGTGLDRVYPSRHRDLAHRIARMGLLISEYPLGTPPLSANFPKRNRIISGLSLGTLVVEAALQSGSLITARLASEQGKDVFAIPGSIHTAQARGCHALIKQGAQLVETPEEVLEELWTQTGLSPVSPVLIAPDGHTTMGFSDNGSANTLLEVLGFDPVGLDALLARTGFDTARLQALLLELELEGAVARLPGGLFQRQVLA